MADTKIEWTDKTWNPVTGCTPISEGCANCYAERMAKRLAGRCGYPEDNPFGVTLHEDKLEEPSTWKKPRRVFVCSMGDLFHEDVPLEWIADVFYTMALVNRHTYLLLTKRPERMRAIIDGDLSGEFVGVFRRKYPNHLKPVCVFGRHIWLGVTVENDNYRWRIEELLKIRGAAVRFVSIEPMLGPVDLERYFPQETDKGPWPDAETDEVDGLSWVICGGESGHGARPIHPDWVRSLRDQCVSADVPFFFKQWGEWAPWGDDNCKYLMEFNCDQAAGKFKSSVMAPYVFYKVGKKRASRLLDGRVWLEYPHER